MGANIRMPRPLSPQLTEASSLVEACDKKFAAFTFIEPSSLYDTVAPNACITPRAALSSLDVPGLCIMLCPLLTSAAAQARCILLLDAGAKMLPLIFDGLTVTCIIKFYSNDPSFAGLFCDSCFIIGFKSSSFKGITTPLPIFSNNT